MSSGQGFWIQFGELFQRTFPAWYCAIPLLEKHCLWEPMCAVWRKMPTKIIANEI